MKKLALVALSIWLNASHILAATGSQDELKALIEGLRQRKHNAGLAVAVFNSTEVLHVSTHGFTDVESQQPVSEQSLFMIGSTTKAMTATAAGYLVQDGLINWDEKVKTYVPEFRLMDSVATDQATLRDLLLHRTGLPRHDFAWLTRTWTSEEYLGLLPLLEPSAEFRSKWQYQNLMYMTAGLMVGAAADSTWDRVIQNKIFDNLDMTSTRALSSQLSPSDEVALPHEWNGSSLVKIAPRNIDGVGPAGSVHSSILDMIKWGQFNLRKGSVEHGQSLARNIIDEIHRPQISTGTTVPFPEFEGEREYAFGWAAAKYRGQQMLGHGGGIDGYLTSVYFSPARDVGVIVLTNGGDLAPDIVMLTVLDHVIGAETVDWLQRLDSSEQPTLPNDVDFPASYAGAEGNFEHPAYGMFRAKQIGSGDGKVLSLNLNGGFDFEVTPWITDDPKIWKFEYSGLEFSFHLSEYGKVERIDTNLEPAVAPIQFVKRADLPIQTPLRGEVSGVKRHWERALQIVSLED